MTFSEREYDLMYTVLNALVRRPYSELNTMYGSDTIDAMQVIFQKLDWREWLDARGMAYEQMTESDWMEAYAERYDA
jgi:hypothetical protein